MSMIVVCLLVVSAMAMSPYGELSIVWALTESCGELFVLRMCDTDLHRLTVSLGDNVEPDWN